MSLSPLLALRIPHLQGSQAGAGHGEVGGVEDIASLAINILAAVAEAKDLEDGELAAQVHGNKLCAALLVRGGNAAKDGTPSLARLVPCGNGLAIHGADRWVRLVEVESSGGGLL